MRAFDGNSIEKMMSEVNDASRLFKKLFESEQALFKNFTQYKNLINEINIIISKLEPKFDFPLDTIFEEKNFNFLFRLTAASSKYFDIFQLLLNNREMLNIILRGSLDLSSLFCKNI